MTTKKRPGRPRKQPAPTGASLRETAAHFGVSRAVINKWLEQGMPSTLHNERRWVDLRKAEAWKADHDARPVEPSKAAVLHPSDPRYVQSATAARVKGFQLALAQGNMVPVKSAVDRAATALVVLNARLNALPSNLADLRILNRHNAESILAPLVADVLAEFTPDDPDHWEDSPFAADDGEDPDEFEDKVYLPVLPYADPRAAVARANAAKWQAELDKLEESSITVDDVRRIMREQADKVRKVVGKIPGLVAARLGDADPVHVIREVMLFEIDAARHAALITMGAKPTWTPSPPSTPDDMEDEGDVASDFESEPDDDFNREDA